MLCHRPLYSPKQVQEALKEAEEVCGTEGKGQDCSVAMDTVEELSAKLAHERVKDKQASAVLRF